MKLLCNVVFQMTHDRCYMYIPHLPIDVLHYASCVKYAFRYLSCNMVYIYVMPHGGCCINACISHANWVLLPCDMLSVYPMPPDQCTKVCTHVFLYNLYDEHYHLTRSMYIMSALTCNYSLSNVILTNEKKHFLPRISRILLQKWHYCIHYDKRHHMNLIPLCCFDFNQCYLI